jgi:hypothetical protein
MIPKLFTKEKNKEAEEIKQFLPVNVKFNFETFAPALALAEQNYIIPILGKVLFNKLVAYYEGVPDDSEYEELVRLVQFSECRLAYWKNYNTLSVMITDSGASRDTPPDKTLFRSELEALLSELKNDGFDQLDVVIKFLEDNIDVFPEFKKSEYSTLLTNTFIPDTTTFNKIYNITNSRLVFLKMKYFVRDVERIELVHNLGSEFIKEILENADDDKYKPILGNIQTYIVLMSVAKGIAELHKSPTEKGLVFETESASAGSNVKVDVVRQREMQQTKEYFTQRAEQYMAMVINYLNKNSETFPAFRAFAGKDAPTDSVINRNNDNKKTFVV